MQWTRSDGDAAIFELIDEVKGGPPLARVGFTSDDRAACELAPTGRVVFSYVSDPKSAHVVDAMTDRVLGVIPLSWKDSGTLNLGGEPIEWQYAGVFSKARQWVDRRGAMLVEIGTIDMEKSTEVKLGDPSDGAALLAALGWFLKVRCDQSTPPQLVTRRSPLAWALPAPTLAWTESEHPEAQFELRLGDADPLAQLTILSATTGAGAVKRFGGATEDGKWILELAERRLEVRNADTKTVVATMEVEDSYAGELSFGGARHSWSCADDAWTFAGRDGRPILTYREATATSDFELELHGEHPHASFLAFVGFFVVAMKYASDDMLLAGVSLSPDESVGTHSSSGSGVTASDAIDVAGAIFDLLD